LLALLARLVQTSKKTDANARLAEYAKTLDSEHNIDSTKPFEVRHWKEDSWAGRKKEGTLAIIKGQSIDSTTGLSFWCVFMLLVYAAFSY
jgi:hypothetical protein